MKKIDAATLLRYLSVMNSGEIDFFLGSGASAQAGIPTGGTMIWDFKRELYCTENEVSKELFKDLNAEITRNILQKHFDTQGKHPALYSSNEYAHYFELCHPSAIARERYIQSKVNDIAPSIGHLCLGDLFINKRVVNIWTTNFDELVEAGIKTLTPHHSFNVYSSANKSIAPSNTLSSVIKLHGDYRYDHILNTPAELQSLESSMKTAFADNLKNKGLVVIGYSGSDESIMSILEQGLSNPDFLKYGLIWAVPEGVALSTRLSTLMEDACKKNENSAVVEIQSFDEFAHSIYTSQSNKNDLIENLWKDYQHRKLPVSFQSAPTTNFTKLNAFESVIYPSCMVFDTDISSWKQLKSIIGDNDIIASFYAGKIYCFEDETEINRVFGSHVNSQITEERVPNRIFYRTDSIYIGMLYLLIKKILITEFGLTEFRRNKYYDPTMSQRDNDLNCLIYNALEISLSVHKGKIYLNIIPTVFVTDNNGNPYERLENQRRINQAMSKIYNGQYNEILKKWNSLFSKDRAFAFSYKGFSLSFNKIPISSGGTSRQSNWPEKTCYRFPEPEMQFSVSNANQRSVNQLKGMSRYAPLDCSYQMQQTNRPSIEIAIISPQEQANKLLGHLARLNQPIFYLQIKKKGFCHNLEGLNLFLSAH